MPRRFVLSLMFIAATAACSTSHVVRVEGTEVRCQGEMSLTADQCAAWGKLLMEGGIPDVEDVETLIITTTAGGRGRCAADYVYAEGPFTVGASAAIPCTPPEPD